MDSYNKMERLRNEYGVKISGIPLDDESQNVITYSMFENLQTILCYDYEDGKPWHDLTCVMELIFNDPFYDNEKPFEHPIDNFSKIRYLYMHPWNLFNDFSKLVAEFNKCDRLITVKMDLTTGWFKHDDTYKGICFDDFEIFNCTIKHKKHFHPKNPEMPDD
ncbi:hypothetical protein MSI_14180 [Treponema sp. JC4]|uniref:hypothetical protein n=1 Tax=Treponema sp. JC4 TaxID=1124982 RepID=UPI00025AFD53|nr:hypothetical protein [Treponema sp. JC4]EID85035.1 hypothetical protein MSI_14180 [Treponema sp. JC4]